TIDLLSIRATGKSFLGGALGAALGEGGKQPATPVKQEPGMEGEDLKLGDIPEKQAKQEDPLEARGKRFAGHLPPVEDDGGIRESGE
ncbi:hypothetical protein LTR17_027898, partial [Elasticomyces elasticus]